MNLSSSIYLFIHSIGKKTSNKITKLDDDGNLFKI